MYAAVQLSEVISIELGLYLDLNKFHCASPLRRREQPPRNISYSDMVPPGRCSVSK